MNTKVPVGDDFDFPDTDSGSNLATKVIIYTGPLCNYCDAAKRLLARNNIQYKEINIANVEGALDEMIKKANGKRTIPQIFINDNHIGGYDELRLLEKENKLTDFKGLKKDLLK
jgi:glutaredoxin 3